MKNLNHQQAYILLEVLVALALTTLLLNITLHYQLQLVKKAASEFERFSSFNEWCNKEAINQRF